MCTVKARVRVYRSMEELPEVVEPGRYVIGGVEVVVNEPVGREELAYQLRKNRELIERYGSKGWV
ncbi:MAG: hypothetical protein GSR84_08430 [Desulfurococcales archaeon]|nr:hypothetical protein [Desulfurococcales archaeon]